MPLVRRLINDYPHIPARLLIGDERPTSNPKLNNIVKGWAAARHPWIVIADNNVLMPQHYLDDLFASFGPGTGLVCSPPIGSRPIGFWAELECAFLNGYQARWQYAADTIGFGFAQGKSMLWRRDMLDVAGVSKCSVRNCRGCRRHEGRAGVWPRCPACRSPLRAAAWTKIAAQVWNRQVRWARLRRATFPAFYVPELLTGSALPIASGVFAAQAFGYEPLSVLSCLMLLWFGAEAVLARAARWHIGIFSPLAWVLRDLLLPVLWLEGWSGNKFVWRGNDMSVAKSGAGPDCIANQLT